MIKWFWSLVVRTHADIWRLIALAKAPIIIVLAFFFVTQTSKQLPELILGYAQLVDASSEANATAFLVFVLTLYLAAYTFELIAGFEDESPANALWRRPALVTAFIVLVAGTPAVWMVVAISFAARTADGQFPEVAVNLADFQLKYGTAAFLAVAGATVFCYRALRLRNDLRIDTFWARRVVLIHLSPTFAVITWFTVARWLRTEYQELNGSSTIFFALLFFLIWTILFCSVYYSSSRRSWPLFALFGFYYVTLCISGYNDHHFIDSQEVKVGQHVSSDKYPNIEREALDSGVRGWMRGRDPRRPIYLIAAQGGGIYAAYHAASVIAELIGPRHGLANDIFAISGVSGGSIGSAVVVALAHAISQHEQQIWSERTCETVWQTDDQLKAAIDAVFRGDFVFPLIAGGLYVDSLLEIVPNRALPRFYSGFDRALLLERAFVSRVRAALKDVVGKEPEKTLLDIGIADYRSMAEFRPNLFYNAVSANTGDRAILASYELDKFKLAATDPDREQKRLLNRALTGLNINLIAAAVLSARFPYVTPPASIKISLSGKTSVLRFVDGGYFDNSGIATALDVIRELRVVASEAPIYLIVLGGKSAQSVENNSLNELATPIQTMLQTRIARSEGFIEEAKREISPGNVIEFRESPPDITLTLGWFLSARTLDYIKNNLKRDFEEKQGLGQQSCARPDHP